MVSAVAALAGALVVFTGGRALAAQNLQHALHGPGLTRLHTGLSLDVIWKMSGPLWDSAVEDRHGALVARAVLAAAIGLCLLVFGLYALNGSVWARVSLTVSAVLAGPVHALIWSDYEPASVTVASLTAVAAAMAAVVLAWLPPNSRYTSARPAPDRP